MVEGVIVVTGLSLAASIITIKNGVNDIMSSRGRVRESNYERVRVNIDNLGPEILLMVKDNKKLLGYKELHKETQTLLSYFDSLHGFLHNIYDDECDTNNLKQHIKDASLNLAEKVSPQNTRIEEITEKNNYLYLKEDHKVQFYVNVISRELESLRSAVQQVTENTSQKLDRSAKTKSLNIIESLGSFMQHLDMMIKTLSENLEKEITLLETELNKKSKGEG